MAGITQTIPQYSLGMSEQSDSLKFPGQVKEVTNAIPDVTKGLFKRPGLKRVDTSAISDVSRTVSTDEGKLKDLQDSGAYFHYFRDETEGSYIGQIASDGEVRVWRCSDGKKMTVNYGTGGATALKAYLTTSDPENLQTLTINDTTFVCNRDVTRSQTAVGLTGTTDARPDDHFALIELLRAENGRQYGLNITNGTDDASRNVTLKRATRIRIKSQTLNESTGGGECLGIGTEVFDITARIDRPEQTGTDIDTYRLPTAAISTTNNRFGPLSNHGYENDQAFIYHSPGSVITGLTNNRDYYIRDKNANGFDLSQAPGSQSSTINIQSSGDNNQILIPAEKGIVLNSSGNVVTDGSKKNLVFRISTLGQQGNADNSPNDFICSYQPEVTLLHGGEGWETGDKIIVGMTGQGFGGGGKNSDGDDLRIALYTLEITDHEETVVQAKYSGAETGLIRPAVTPFDSDTTVTSDTILAGMKTAIEGISGSPINVKIIGTTMYLSSTSTFNIEVVEEDLMRVMQDSTNEVTNLPNQCKHGYIVQVKNARMADEDDYYLRFDGQNDKDGAGAWSECAKPGIDKNFTNMPIVIQRTSVAETFEVRQFEYEDRRVGDENTNPLPSFLSRDSNNNFDGRIN